MWGAIPHLGACRTARCDGGEGGGEQRGGLGGGLDAEGHVEVNEGEGPRPAWGWGLGVG